MAQISSAVSKIQGDNGYPDATFTLRLAFGQVKSYREDGSVIAPTTDFAGAFRHQDSHRGQTDFELPKSWNDAKDQLDLATEAIHQILELLSLLPLLRLAGVLPRLARGMERMEQGKHRRTETITKFGWQLGRPVRLHFQHFGIPVVTGIELSISSHL